MSPIITVENLSKQYRLGQIGTGAIGHDLNRWWHRLRGRENPYLKIGEENNRAVKGISDYVWALSDINFTIQPGEVIGIIGRNGAGKSTLLKILSRTTAPTKGRVRIHGRVASLLEVGTGFHPDLSGRDNIYLNGAILGMTRSEISRKFDEIVAFAGVERYIDTPVKRYSSGMHVRLGFAVAAHLEPDILIVDEVLAVGDAEFQKKCLGKMKDVSEKQGRTVLFVSHQLNAIRSLCNRSLLMKNGRLAMTGITEKVLQAYNLSDELSNTWLRPENHQNPSHDYFILKAAQMVNDQGIPGGSFPNNAPIGVHLSFTQVKHASGFIFGISVFGPDNQLLFHSFNTDAGESDWVIPEIGDNEVTVWIPPHFLNEGSYRVEVVTGIFYIKWFYEPGVNAPALEFAIAGGLSHSPQWIERRPGLLAPYLHFEPKKTPVN